MARKKSRNKHLNGKDQVFAPVFRNAWKYSRKKGKC